MNSSIQDFYSLNNRLFQLFQNKQYAEALDLATRKGPDYPRERAGIDYWRMCAAARVKNHQLVFQIAEQALAEGLWYGEMMWRMTPSFKALQGDPDFERIVAASRALQERDAPTDKAVLLTRLPQDHSAASPLLVALHGNERTAAHTLPFWQVAVSRGWVLALPQSTQAMYNDAFGWDDLETSYATIRARFEGLQGHVAFDPRRVVLAGHSMGALVAIQMALRGTPHVRGFVANGPAVPFLDAPEELEALLVPALERGVRGYFIVGEKDNAIFADKVHELAEKLQAA
ncbi:MAG: hypothetical protein PVF45_14930, partial [Anaerolineae bacterium]